MERASEVFGCDTGEEGESGVAEGPSQALASAAAEEGDEERECGDDKEAGKEGKRWGTGLEGLVRGPDGERGAGETGDGEARGMDLGTLDEAAGMEDLDGVGAGGFESGEPCAGKGGEEAEGGGGEDVDRGNDGVTGGDQDVEIRNGLGDLTQDSGAEKDATGDPDGNADEADGEGFAKEERHDLDTGSAIGAENPDFATTTDDGGGDGVVDEEDADENGDETEGEEIEAKAVEHALNLEGTLRGSGHGDRIGERSGQGIADGFDLGRVLEEDLDGGEVALGLEELLGPADIHEGGALGGRGLGGAGVIWREEVTDDERAVLAVGLDCQRIAEVDLEGLGKVGGKRDGVWVGEPGVQVEGLGRTAIGIG